MMSSPTSPRGTSINSSSTAFTVRPGRATPTLAVFLTSGVLTAYNGRAFAQAVAFQQFGTREFGFEVVNGLFGQRCAAADKQADAVEPSEIPRDFGFAHGSVNSRYAEEMVARLSKTCFNTLENGKTDLTKIIEQA